MYLIILLIIYRIEENFKYKFNILAVWLLRIWDLDNAVSIGL